jgi:hypothetical protein
MKLPPFTLVHNPGVPRGTFVKTYATLKRREPNLVFALERIRPRLAASVLGSTMIRSVPDGSVLDSTLEALELVQSEMSRGEKVLAVGIWGLETRAGNIPDLLEALNAAQATFTFFEVQAAIPAGLVSQRQKVLAWAESKLGRKLPSKESQHIRLNVIADEVFPRAEKVRQDLGLDYLVAITPYMIAGEDSEEIYWNHFSMAQGDVSIISTAQLRELAQTAGRPFEVALAALMISSLLVGLNPRLGFHSDNGCLFDYNGGRHTLAGTIAKPRIEGDCLKLIKPRFREAASSLVEAVEKYHNTAPESVSEP